VAAPLDALVPEWLFFASLMKRQGSVFDPLATTVIFRRDQRALYRV